MGTVGESGEFWFREAERHLQKGEREAVVRCLRTCIGTNDPRWVAQGGASLGRLLWQLSDLDQARDVLRRAVAVGHPEWSGLAGVVLGLLETEMGNRSAATRIYRSVAATTSSASAAANARFNLATIHQQAREIAEAIELYREVVAGPDKDMAAEAGVNLGYVLVTYRGDVGAAAAAFRAVIATGHPVQAPLARMNLNALPRDGDPPTVVVDELVDVSTGLDTSTNEQTAIQLGIVSHPRQ